MILPVTSSDESTNGLKRGERSDIYLTHVCRRPQSIKSVERIGKNQKLSANAVAFISCKSSPWPSADMSQVGVVPFSAFQLFFLSFHFSTDTSDW